MHNAALCAACLVAGPSLAWPSLSSVRPALHVRTHARTHAHTTHRVNAFTATAAAVARLPRGELEVVADSENTHVIAGDIFAPRSNERLVRRALEFATRAAAGASH